MDDESRIREELRKEIRKELEAKFEDDLEKRVAQEVAIKTESKRLRMVIERSRETLYNRNTTRNARSLIDAEDAYIKETNPELYMEMGCAGQLSFQEQRFDDYSDDDYWEPGYDCPDVEECPECGFIDSCDCCQECQKAPRNCDCEIEQ